MLLIIGISTFVCITLGMMGVYWLLYRPQSAATQRLKRLHDNDQLEIAAPISLEENKGGAEFAQRLASPLSKLLPPSAAEAKKLQKQLMQAGFRTASAPVIFRGLQLASLAGFPATVALICAIMARPLNSAVLWILMAKMI